MVFLAQIISGFRLRAMAPQPLGRFSAICCSENTIWTDFLQFFSKFLFAGCFKNLFNAFYFSLGQAANFFRFIRRDSFQVHGAEEITLQDLLRSDEGNEKENIFVHIYLWLKARQFWSMSSYPSLYWNSFSMSLQRCNIQPWCVFYSVNLFKTFLWFF